MVRSPFFEITSMPSRGRPPHHYRPARTASFRNRSINRNSAVASGSSFFNGWRSTPGTAPLTSQFALLISTTTTKVEIGSNALRLSLAMDDKGATTPPPAP